MNSTVNRILCQKKSKKRVIFKLKIESIELLHMDDPFYVNKWIVQFQISYDKSCTFLELPLETKEEAMLFCNTFNEKLETSNGFDTLSSMSALFPKNELLNLFYKDYKSHEPTLTPASIMAYYDQFGRERRFLVNKRFCPESTFHLYSDVDYLLDDDGYKFKHFDIMFFLERDEDTDQLIFDENECEYLFRLNIEKLSRYGFIPQLSNTYSINDSIDLFVNKKDLSVIVPKEENAFKSLFVRNQV